MKKFPKDLLIILGWVIFTIFFVVAPVLKESIIRTILGIPMVLIIPGYVLISALFPRNDYLGLMERIMLSFGLSIAVVPLIGLGLNYTQFDIGIISVLFSLTIYTIFFIIVGAYRRYELNENERFSISFQKIFTDVKKEFFKQSKLDGFLITLLIITMIVSIGMLIYVVIIPKTGEKFSEFYILNSSTDKADNYNTNLKINQPVKYLVGVINHEYNNVNYTIMAGVGEDILFSKNLTLGNDEEWEYNLTIVPNKKGDDMKLKFLLFKDNDFILPYREIYLWVNVS